ncbi:hypothetical protein BDF19DRAFT_449325 [Syncephalis fuscata]|nr:hypothetical protein BDF19DRAFT_449325 [Syncephalis fuscata]
MKNDSTNKLTFFRLITSTILVRHCYNMRKMFTLSHQPKTENVLHLSQIVTANPYHSI